jgi:hypothetical protein
VGRRDTLVVHTTHLLAEDPARAVVGLTNALLGGRAADARAAERDK